MDWYRYYITVPCKNYHYPIYPVDSCDYVRPTQYNGHTVYGWVVFNRKLDPATAEKHHLIEE